MSAVIQIDVLERFRSAVSTRLGLAFDESKSGLLVDVLRRRFESSGEDPDAYVSRLETERSAAELGSLARELTVPETYFFRNVDQCRAFQEIVLPERLARHASDRRLRILSLGCASGEEAYSLSMLVRETLGADPGWNVSIVGVDVNPAMVVKAKRGRFSVWALRQTPDPHKQRWFRPDGREFVLEEDLRASVRFEERNLVDEDSRFWQHETADVVFCRNVVMYFTPEHAQAIIARIARVLAPGGYLFLGHAETLRGLSNAFHLRHTHGTFYYQRKDDEAREATASDRTSNRRRASEASLAELAARAETWVDAIQRASERVATLTDRRHRGHAGEPAATAAARWDLGLVLERLRHERFAEALALVEALPAESARDADVLLLRAVLLVHGGHFSGAESTCRQLLEVDGLSAGAHYLLALCREDAGDRSAARHHDSVAAYLDPGFAMPRLHLGLLARRDGEDAVARRELGHALVLLQREDASRILLFGGGFGREALATLCGTELARCGGKR